MVSGRGILGRAYVELKFSHRCDGRAWDIDARAWTEAFHHAFELGSGVGIRGDTHQDILLFLAAKCCRFEEKLHEVDRGEFRVPFQSVARHVVTEVGTRDRASTKKLYRGTFAREALLSWGGGRGRRLGRCRLFRLRGLGFRRRWFGRLSRRHVLHSGSNRLNLAKELRSLIRIHVFHAIFQGHQRDERIIDSFLILSVLRYRQLARVEVIAHRNTLLLEELDE